VQENETISRGTKVFETPVEAVRSVYLLPYFHFMIAMQNAKFLYRSTPTLMFTLKRWRTYQNDFKTSFKRFIHIYHPI